MPTLLLNGNAVKALTKMSDVINVVEKAKITAETYVAVEKRGFRAMPAALPGCEGVKMGKRTARESISGSTFDLERDGNQ